VLGFSVGGLGLGIWLVFGKLSVDFGNNHNPRVNVCVIGMETMVLLNCLVFKTFQCAMLRHIASFGCLFHSLTASNLLCQFTRFVNYAVRYK